MEIRGKRALVTGGGVRIGKAIVLMLAAAGADVVVNFNQSQLDADATVAEAQSLGVEAIGIRADVADADAVRSLRDEVLKRFGGIDILINSASFFARTPVLKDDPALDETWRKVTRVLIDGPWYLCNAFAPGMIERGAGIIINIADLTALEPWRGFAAHAVGKAGLLALTRQFALELAPAVRVNAVAPGNVLPPDHMADRKTQAMAERALLARWGTPEDVTQAVRYLIEADFVTGETLVVDGGERFWRSK